MTGDDEDKVNRELFRNVEKLRQLRIEHRDLDEIIIRSRPLPDDIPEQRVLPKGLSGLWWGVNNPTQAWRLLAPDPNEVSRPRSPDDPQPPPGAYRSQIGEPGRIF